MKAFSRSYLIGIAGGSGSGKSFLSGFIRKHLGSENVLVMALDSYYRDLSDYEMSVREKTNFDSPDALEHDLIARQLEALLKGQSVQKPVYDFTSHTRKKETEEIFPKQWIILEGLFSLYWKEIRDVLSMKIFIETDTQTGLERRIKRDTRERGRTVESVTEQYRQSVIPMYEKYILPTKVYADIVISGTAAPERSFQTIINELNPKG
ncbi:MAG: uridine kinase [Candidatus Omnitrophica bacterium]|nr:uridine kinase [Candidatus Omnitrophota bacterium]